MNSIDFVKSQVGIKTPWALTPDFLAELDYRLHIKKPRVVLECGSGLSTVVLANYAKSNPEATAISLEHNPKYYEKTLKLLGPLKKYVTLVQVPLAGSPPVYETRLQKFPKIDFVLIDGPPTGEGGRCRIFDWLFPYLDHEYEIWLDDGNRREEQEAVLNWEKEYNLHVNYTGIQKGLIILTNCLPEKFTPTTRDTVVTMLSGARPKLLDRTLSNLHDYIIANMIGLANGGDKETIEVYKNYGVNPIVTPYLLPTGSATSFLADLAFSSKKGYWLQLQDDWDFITQDDMWLERAKKALQESHQVRLRHFSDPVKQTHMYTKKPFKLKTSGCGKVGKMHWTFNPTLQKCKTIPSVFPNVSERDSQKRAVESNKSIVTQLYPGCFLHNGWEDSLIDKVYNNSRKHYDDRETKEIS
jgi:hypothetical protein